MHKPETAIVRACLAYIHTELHGDGYHVHGSEMQRAGEPDIDAAIPRWIRKPSSTTWLHLKIEVKTPGNEPSPLQLYRLRRYAEMGYYTAVVRSLDELIAAVNYFKTTDGRTYGYE